MKYPSLRGLVVEHRTSPARAHYAPDPVLFHMDRQAYAPACTEMWRLCEAQSVHGGDVLTALRILLEDRYSIPAIGPKAAAIARAGMAMQTGNDRAFIDYFDNQVDTTRARYTLYVMEHGGRGEESNRFIGVTSALDAAGLTAELVDYGLHSDKHDSPFDVAIYTNSPMGERIDFQPMVWSGAGSDRGNLKFPQSIRDELGAQGIKLDEVVPYQAVLDAVAPLRESRARHGFGGFHL